LLVKERTPLGHGVARIAAHQEPPAMAAARIFDTRVVEEQVEQVQVA
jgi:hypothetical protein